MFVHSNHILEVIERRKIKLVYKDFHYQNKELQLTKEQLNSISPPVIFAWIKEDKITYKHFLKWKEALCQNVS